jgi:hypothetical protein
LRQTISSAGSVDQAIVMEHDARTEDGSRMDQAAVGLVAAAPGVKRNGAGPIAGFIALIPFLIYGVAHSQVTAIDPKATVIWLGEPLLFKAIKLATIGQLADGMDITIHPMGFAAWFGMLATSLNLLPFGQLDGGHISYAAFGAKSRYISMATLATALGLTVWSFSWISMTIMMIAMAYFLGFGHPSIIDEHEPLDPRRRIIAICAVIIFILCFTPVPIDTLFNG